MRRNDLCPKAVELRSDCARASDDSIGQQSLHLSRLLKPQATEHAVLGNLPVECRLPRRNGHSTDDLVRVTRAGCRTDVPSM